MRREKLLRCIIVCAALVLTAGCSVPVPELPGCDSAVTLDLVREIIQRSLDVSPEGFTIELVEASAGSMGDKGRGSYTCLAHLTLEGTTAEQAATEWKWTKWTIQYVVHRLATDDASFAVNVYSLPPPGSVRGYGTGAIPSGPTN